MENKQKILSEDRRGMWFPLTVALACFMGAMLIMVYILNMASGVKHEYVDLTNGYQLVIADDNWIADKEEISVIAPNVTRINVLDDKIFYRRESEGEVEVGCFDTRKKYFIHRTTESYDALEKEFYSSYDIKLIKIEEYKKRDSQ